MLFFIMYVYKNYFQEDNGTDFGDEVEYDGKGSVAYAKGNVVEVTTHDQFRAALQQHKDDTDCLSSLIFSVTLVDPAA